MPQMTSSELAAARAELAITPERMAAELDVPLADYRRWEAGTTAIPRRAARQVAFLRAHAARAAALAASGLAACEWAAVWESIPFPEGLDALEKHLDAREAHVAGCTVCQRRDEWVKAHGPPLPIPAMGIGGIFVRLAAVVERLPAWLRPAAVGAGLLAAMAIVRVVFLLPRALREPRLLFLALGAVAAAAAAGAVGGLVYSALGRPARRVPVVGPYLAGVVAVAGYLGVFAVPLHLSGTESFDRRASLLAFGATTLLFGSILGHIAFRKR